MKKRTKKLLLIWRVAGAGLRAYEQKFLLLFSKRSASFSYPDMTTLLFVIWVSPLLIATCVVMPPWTSTDEPAHMLRAVEIAHGEILGDRLSVPRAGDGAMVTGAGGSSDGAILEAFRPLHKLAFSVDERVTATELVHSGQVKWHRRTDFEWIENTVQYAPFFYVPDAMAYWLGRAFGLRVDPTLLLARLCNATMFAALSGLAIARAKRTRPLLLVVLMLPMSIALGASANQDALLIPLAALIVSWLDRIMSEARAPRTRELCILSVAIGMVAMARPPYASLILLPLQTAPPRRSTTIAICVTTAAILVWCGLIAIFVMVPIGGSNPALQWHLLVTHPGTTLTIVRNTVSQVGLYASEFIGRLAWNDGPLPASYIGLAGATLALAASAVMTEPAHRRRWPILAIVFAVCTIFVLQYLDWTPTGADHVEGVVGRYFTPLAFVLGLALPAFRPGTYMRRQAARVGVLALGLVTPAVMMHHLVLRFYLGK